MMAASEEMRFEDAAGYRDLINSIRRIGERQKITTYGEEDRDIIAVAMDESEDLREQDAVVQVFFYAWRQADRQRSLFSPCGKRRYQSTGFVKLSEAVLCRNAFYSGGNHDADRDRGWGNY